MIQTLFLHKKRRIIIDATPLPESKIPMIIF